MSDLSETLPQRDDARADLEDLISVTEHHEARAKLQEALALMEDPAYELLVECRNVITVLDHVLYDNLNEVNEGSGQCWRCRKENADTGVTHESRFVKGKRVQVGEWLRETQSLLRQAVTAYEDRKKA
jgi:hypothetical protein